MEFEFHDERRVFDTYTVPDGISNSDSNNRPTITNTNGYGCADVDADSFSNPNRNPDTYSRA
jgi:hypothetical protein